MKKGIGTPSPLSLPSSNYTPGKSFIKIHLFNVGKTAKLKKFLGSLLCKTSSELFKEKMADQEEIGNSGIQLMVERWTYFVTDYFRKSCNMMIGDIAILSRLRETHMALQLPVFFSFFFSFSFSFFCQPYPEYQEVSEQKIILQTIEQPIQFSCLFL